MSTLGALSISSVDLAVPKYGDWRADVVCSSGEPPTEGAGIVLTVGDLEMHGYVLRSGLDAPGKPHVVVVGAPGWDSVLERPLAYRSDVGVRLLTVVRDLASRAEQEIEEPAYVALGEHFDAPGGLRLRDVLSLLERAGRVKPWRVDADGVTRFGARVGETVTARATQLRNHGGLGVTTYGIDSPASFLPGGIVDDVTIDRVVIHETAGKLSAEVWSSPYTAAGNLVSSLRAAILRIVVSALPWLFFSFPRTYLVASVRSDKRLDLVPPPDATHLPELAAVEQWGLGRVTPALGAEVGVLFRDANPERPMVVSWGAGTPGVAETIPAGTETRRAVCYGDVVPMPTGAAATPLGVLLVPASSVGGPPAPPATPVIISRVEL